MTLIGPRRLVQRLGATLLLIVALAGAPVSAAVGTPGEETNGFTWPELAQRMRCMLASFLDLGVTGFSMGWGSCSVYIRIDREE